MLKWCLGSFVCSKIIWCKFVIRDSRSMAELLPCWEDSVAFDLDWQVGQHVCGWLLSVSHSVPTWLGAISALKKIIARAGRHYFWCVTVWSYSMQQVAQKGMLHRRNAPDSSTLQVQVPP